MRTLDKELWDILMKETQHSECFTSNIKDPDYVYEVCNSNGIHRIDIVADVPYKEVKDNDGYL